MRLNLETTRVVPLTKLVRLEMTKEVAGGAAADPSCRRLLQCDDLAYWKSALPTQSFTEGELNPSTGSPMTFDR